MCVNDQIHFYDRTKIFAQISSNNAIHNLAINPLSSTFCSPSSFAFNTDKSTSSNSDISLSEECGEQLGETLPLASCHFFISCAQGAFQWLFCFEDGVCWSPLLYTINIYINFILWFGWWRQFHGMTDRQILSFAIFTIFPNWQWCQFSFLFKML